MTATFFHVLCYAKVMSATGGGLVAICIQRMFHKHWSLMLACNGAIAGTVAAT